MNMLYRGKRMKLWPSYLSSDMLMDIVINYIIYVKVSPPEKVAVKEQKTSSVFLWIK